MPRTFARITTSIWRSRRFVEELTLAQQGAYFMLETQGEITAAGTLALTERRWSKLSKGMTPERLRVELDELQRAGHVLIDDDTEEVLVVKFVRWDGGYTNTKRIPVIRDAARAIVSPALRAALAAELADLGLTDIASSIDPDSPSDTPPDSPSPPPRNSPSNQGRDSPSDAVSPSERVGVTEVEEEEPQPPTPEWEPSATASGMPDQEPPTTCSAHPDGTETACGPCGAARRRNHAWHAQRDADQAAARQALAAARRACPHCDDNGLIERPDGRGLTRCDHQPEARSA
jgi:hypothetical protein